MKPETIIEIVVVIALIVILGFLIISMFESFVAENGVIWDFIKTTLQSIVDKATQLIGSFGGSGGNP